MKKLMLIIVSGLLVLSLNGCEKSQEAAKNYMSDVDLCVNRGVAYFKEIGSYPTLSSGRSASEVVIERCNRTSTAF